MFDLPPNTDIVDRLERARMETWRDEREDMDLAAIEDAIQIAQDEIIDLRSTLTDTNEHLTIVEGALREVFDVLDDVKRGLVTIHDLTRGPCVHNLVSDHYSIKSLDQEIRDWMPEENR